jgi:hypothetical protein
MQQQGAQCKADKHGREDVEDCGFHDGSLNERQASGVDVSSDKRSSEGGGFDAVVLRSVCASVNSARLLLGADKLICLDCVCHGVLLWLLMSDSVRDFFTALESFFNTRLN